MYLQVLATSRITADLSLRLRREIAMKYTRVDYRFFITKTAGYLNNLITLEVDRAVSGLSKFCELISYLIYIAVYLGAATLINYALTLFVLGVSIILMYSFRFLYRLSAMYSMAVSSANATMQSTLIQMIHNFKYLKATDSFTKLFEMFSGTISQLAKLSFRLGALGGVLQSLLEPFVVLSMCLLVFYHVQIAGKPLAELMILLVFFHRTFSKVFSVQMTWQKFSASVGGVATVEAALCALDQNIDSESVDPAPIQNGDILFDRVSFSYESKQILQDITLRIPEKMSVAVVGESGAGKTTFFDLMSGLLTPQSGTISINGKSYRQIDFHQLRSMIGYVTQEPVIFNDTVANNIAFWECDPNYSDCLEKIERAAHQAYCADFIEQMPDSYHTVVGDKGVKLSGGQRQRIAIAREVFKNPEILIFDEATSSLDTQSEQFIQKSIAMLKGSLTMVIIAHRLSTIKDCDIIYVFSEGKIVESGSFDELYAKIGGYFRKMCLAQSL